MVSNQTGNVSPLSVRRLDRYSWFTLAIGLFILGLGAAISVASYRMPADGWLVSHVGIARYESLHYEVSLPGINPDLKEGDVLLEINGESLEELEEAAAKLKPKRPENWEQGENVKYTVLRNGSLVSVVVTLQRPPLALGYRTSILRGNLDILTGLIYLLTGILLFLLRPRQRASQLIFLFGTAYFVTDLMSWGAAVPSGVADLFSKSTYWPRIIMGNMLWMLLLWPLLVHLFLIFPVPKNAVRRFSFFIPLVYILGVGTTLLFYILILLNYELAIPVAFVTLALPLLIVAFSLLHSLVTIKQPVLRMQIRWIVFGGLIGIAGYMIVAIVEYFTLDPGESRFLFGLILLFVSTALPISLAVAVLRYRLWDIDIIINRSLVYATLTGTLALIYFGSVVLLQALFRTLTEQGSPIAIVISTLVIAGLFSPIRSRVQQFIDRRFFRRKYDAELILGRFAASVRDEADLDHLKAELLRVVNSAMQVEHSSIWLKEPAGTKRRNRYH